MYIFIYKNVTNMYIFCLFYNIIVFWCFLLHKKQKKHKKHKNVIKQIKKTKTKKKHQRYYLICFLQL